MNTRATAAHLINEVLSKQRSLRDVMSSFHSNSSQDRAFVQAVVFGVLRLASRLAFITEQLVPKPVKDPIVKHLLYVGIYQLQYMEIPDYAAVKETVDATHSLKKRWARSLINAVLRQAQRQQETLEEKVTNNESAWFAHPEWWIDHVKRCWPNEWKTILTNNNQPPPLALRINCQKTSREQYLNTLKTAKIAARALEPTKYGLIVETPQDPTTLPGFEQGCFSVQDGASQWVSHALDLHSSAHVLDACAAPGGKTTQLLEAVPNLNVLALDISKSRLTRLEENLSRLQLQASIQVGNATQPDTWWDKRLFDRILVDAPCSGSGVIRRHPDIKHLRHPSDLPTLCARQAKLLQTLWPLLQPGGRLLYTTCSIFPEENVQILTQFVNQTADAKPLPLNLPVGHAQAIGVQIFPGDNDMDGFYYACLEKHPTL